MSDEAREALQKQQDAEAQRRQQEISEFFSFLHK